MAVFEAARSARPSTREANGEIASLKDRDPDAWARLFEAEHPVIFRAALSQLGDRGAAEDICGQVFLEAVEGIDRFRETGRPIRAWLLAITRHRVTDWVRRRRREQARVEELVPVPAPPAEERALTALAGLTPEQREIVHLRFIEGYAIEEVARLTSRSAGAVKALQHRALARLRALLDPEIGSEIGSQIEGEIDSETWS